MSAEHQPRDLPPPIKRVGRSPTATDDLQPSGRPLADVDRPMSRLRHGAVDPAAATEAIPDFESRGGGATPDQHLSKRIRRVRRREQKRRERRIMIACVLGALAAIGALSAVLVHLFAGQG